MPHLIQSRQPDHSIMTERGRKSNGKGYLYHNPFHGGFLFTRPYYLNEFRAGSQTLSFLIKVEFQANI